MMGEKCQHCRVLSHSSFNLCPRCGRPKGEWPPKWKLTFADGEDTTVNETDTSEYATQFTAVTEPGKRPWWKLW